MQHKQRPLFDQVIVQRLDEKSKSTILVKEVQHEKSMRAKVIAVGPGTHKDGTFVATEVKPGNIVLIGKYAGTVYEEMEDDFKTAEYVILREEMILSVFEESTL